MDADDAETTLISADLFLIRAKPTLICSHARPLILSLSKDERSSRLKLLSRS